MGDCTTFSSGFWFEVGRMGFAVSVLLALFAPACIASVAQKALVARTRAQARSKRLSPNP